MADNNDQLELNSEATTSQPGTSCTEDSSNAKKMDLYRHKYECEECFYKTSKGTAMEYHRIAMHQAYDPECCNDFFPSREALIEHVNLKHKEGFNCTRCNQQFRRVALLNRHYNIHEPAKHYECQHCSFVTRFKSCIREHRKTHETEQANDGSESESTSEEEEEAQFLTLGDLRKYY